MSPIWITLKTATCAAGLAFLTGLLAARLVFGMRRFRGLMDGLFTLPLVLPPTVIGFFLLILFGRNSPLGQFLLRWEIQLVFSWGAAVISATVVSFPMMYRTALGAFEQMDQNLMAAARTLGMSEWKIFWKIIIPVCRRGILAGGILSLARAIGEFGATMMVAGNIPGKTQTLSTAVYTAMQAGDREQALRWVLVILAISLPMMLLMNFIGKTRQKGGIV